MKTCYIFGAAPMDDYTHVHPHIEKEDTVICADGGYGCALACGIKPDWIVGDFDSEKSDVLLPNVIRVKPEKDDTDMQLALSHGRTLGYSNFVIYGALGGRFDHAYANIQLVIEQLIEGVTVKLIDSQNEIFAIQNTRVVLSKTSYKYVSLLCYSERCEGVTLTGMKYPLDDYTLTYTSGGLGVSNEIIGENATITVKNGILLVMQTADR